MGAGAGYSPGTAGGGFSLEVEEDAFAGPVFCLKVEVETSAGIFLTSPFDEERMAIFFALLDGSFEGIAVKLLVRTWMRLLQGGLLGKVVVVVSDLGCNDCVQQQIVLTRLLYPMSRERRAAQLKRIGMFSNR